MLDLLGQLVVRLRQAQRLRVRQLWPLAAVMTSASRRGVAERDVLAGMMTAEDVAEIVVFVLTRPRTHRILETAVRPMTETSWG